MYSGNRKKSIAAFFSFRISLTIPVKLFKSSELFKRDFSLLSTERILQVSMNFCFRISFFFALEPTRDCSANIAMQIKCRHFFLLVSGSRLGAAAKSHGCFLRRVACFFD